MGMDELEDGKGSGAEAGGQPGQPAPPAAPAEEDEKEKSARVDAAKAFFRAMYAGEEPPQSFGQPEHQQQADTATQTKCRNCDALEQAAKEAEQKAAEAETLYKRMAADFDNYRRRMEREREESVSIGVKKAAEAMMPALDDLDRAMQFLNPDTPSEKVIESFKLVANRILSCMEQVGLKQIDAVGQPFDPKYHEPVQQIETSEHPDGTVMQELRRGYQLHDRVVRPALVNVASNPHGHVQTQSAPADANPAPTDEAEPEPAAPADPAPADESQNTVYDLEDTPDV